MRRLTIIVVFFIGILVGSSGLAFMYEVGWRGSCPSSGGHFASLETGSTSCLLLAAPPVQATVGAATPPLNTSEISLIAYYKLETGWKLSSTVPAFISYFDGGNYYDGVVRVWDSGTIGSKSPYSDDAYVDVHVRVRADGWILAWFLRDEDQGAIVWWGHVRNDEGAPPTYSTTLSRAIEIVFHVAAVGFPGYDKICLYDYSEPNATRLLIFGTSLCYDTETFYYTIPPESPLMPLKLLVRAGGKGYSWLKVDGALIYHIVEYRPFGWYTYEIDAIERGVQHSVQVYAYGCASVALIMWAS